MSTINNIFKLKFNRVDATASINFSNTIHIGAETPIKSVGGSSSVGDFTRHFNAEQNVYIDPDIFDTTRGV